MPRNRDLFNDSTMTFGEHLEVLRVHVWRALIGLVIGVVAALFLGDKVIGVLSQPIDEALRRNNKPEATDDMGGMDFSGFIKQMFSEEEGKPDKPPAMEETPVDNELKVDVSIASLVAALKTVAPELVVDKPNVPEKKEAAEPDDTDTEADAETSSAESSEPVESVSLVLRSDEIALFKKTADRFNRPVTYKVEEAFMTYLKVSLVAGLVLAAPWVFYQAWLFVAAGLYPHERKHVYIYLPMSIGLFMAGAVFCFYFVFPIVLDFLIKFNEWIGVELQPRLSEYISLVLMLPVMFGLSFQLPLVMLFLDRIGVMTVKGYLENWRMAVIVIAIVSMLMTPADPTSMLLMMFPLVFLYFGGIMLCRFRPGASTDPLA